MVHHLSDIPGVKEKVDVGGFDGNVRELLHTMKGMDPNSADFKMLHNTLSKTAKELKAAEQIADMQ
jgi:hypothetical protein